MILAPQEGSIMGFQRAQKLARFGTVLFHRGKNRFVKQDYGRAGNNTQDLSTGILALSTML